MHSGNICAMPQVLIAGRTMVWANTDLNHSIGSDLELDSVEETLYFAHIFTLKYT